MECDNCKSCSYYGVIDVDKDENLVWACTRRECIEFIDTNMGQMPIEDYLEYVNDTV